MYYINTLNPSEIKTKYPFKCQLSLMEFAIFRLSTFVDIRPLSVWFIGIILGIQDRYKSSCFKKTKPWVMLPFPLLSLPKLDQTSLDPTFCIG